MSILERLGSILAFSLLGKSDPKPTETTEESAEKETETEYDFPLALQEATDVINSIMVDDLDENPFGNSLLKDLNTVFTNLNEFVDRNKALTELCSRQLNNPREIIYLEEFQSAFVYRIPESRSLGEFIDNSRLLKRKTEKALVKEMVKSVNELNVIVQSFFEADAISDNTKVYFNRRLISYGENIRFLVQCLNYSGEVHE